MKYYLFFIALGGLLAQQTKSPADRNTAPIVQPGAPGKSGKKLSPATAAARPRTPAAADVGFMQGMIMHHQQAVDMTELLRTHSHDPAMQALGKRMSISQSDEIEFMQQWLKERNAPASMAEQMAYDMAHLDRNDPKAVAAMNESMKKGMIMPGMLTQEQMDVLAKAEGERFDHLFLTGMIQHHGGALTMVEDLFNTAGAGQDNVIYDFATDIDNTQSAEIKIMQDLLKERP